MNPDAGYDGEPAPRRRTLHRVPGEWGDSIEDASLDLCFRWLEMPEHAKRRAFNRVGRVHWRLMHELEDPWPDEHVSYLELVHRVLVDAIRDYYRPDA